MRFSLTKFRVMSSNDFLGIMKSKYDRSACFFQTEKHWIKKLDTEQNHSNVVTTKCIDGTLTV